MAKPTSQLQQQQEDANFEIYDTENYRSDKMQVFNHQMLVMEALRKVDEAGSHELRTGWTNEKMDHSGNIIRTYIEDTRKKFIESSKTAVNVMTCDFDETATKNIKKLKGDLKEHHDTLLKAQWTWFNSLAPRTKIQWEGKIIMAFFNQELGWYLQYIELEVEYYREVLQELHSLTKRLDFYREEDFEV